MHGLFPTDSATSFQQQFNDRDSHCMMELLGLAFLAILATSLDTASSERRCEYTTVRGATVYLEYLEFMRKGEAYVEFEDDRVCLRRVSCGDGYRLRTEECSDEDVSCDPSASQCEQRHFPQCCLKCIEQAKEGMVV